jgi:hypothetical protein
MKASTVVGAVVLAAGMARARLRNWGATREEVDATHPGDDLVENLFGLDIHNADRIHEEWQLLAVGDAVRVGPRGRLGMRAGYAFRVALVDPPRALVLRQQPPEHPWDSTWAFLVVPDSADHCRLLSRSRTAKASGVAGIASLVAAALMEPVILLMTRRMLVGIKSRAEGDARRPQAGLRPTPGSPSLAPQMG